MQRAQRLLTNPPALTAQIAGVKAQALELGQDVIDLASDELHLPLPSALREALGRIIAEAATDSNSASVQAEFCESAARWLAGRYGIIADTESEFAPITGAKAAWTQMVWAAVNPGDGVLIPALAAPWVKASVLLAGGVPYDIPLRAENDWLPDLTAVSGEAVQKAKLLYLNFPHNPTGVVAASSFFQSVVNFAQETGVTILHDASYTFRGAQDPSILQCSGATDVAVEIYAGACEAVDWLPGFAVGHAEAIRAITQVQSAMGGESPIPPLRAAVWAFSNAPWDTTLEMLTRRREILQEGLNDLGWRVSEPQAGPFVWLSVPPGQTSASFAQALLEQANVLTLPGLAFGPTGDGYVRISLRVSEERIAEAVQRMSRIA